MRFAGLLIAASLLAGCSQKDMSDLEGYVADVKARPPGGITPAPEMIEVDTFLYVAGDRRDPFVQQRALETATETVVDSGLRPDMNRPREELERYSLDTLRMVGTLEQDDATWGLVQTQDGTIHRVTTGNHMGLNHGRIVSIAEDKINLVELIQIGAGYQEHEAALGLGEGGQ